VIGSSTTRTRSLSPRGRAEIRNEGATKPQVVESLTQKNELGKSGWALGRRAEDAGCYVQLRDPKEALKKLRVSGRTALCWLLDKFARGALSSAKHLEREMNISVRWVL
jgi:hypothetical protein